MAKQDIEVRVVYVENDCIAEGTKKRAEKGFPSYERTSRKIIFQSRPSLKSSIVQYFADTVNVHQYLKSKFVPVCHIRNNVNFQITFAKSFYRSVTPARRDFVSGKIPMPEGPDTTLRYYDAELTKDSLFPTNCSFNGGGVGGGGGGVLKLAYDGVKIEIPGLHKKQSEMSKLINSNHSFVDKFHKFSDHDEMLLVVPYDFYPADNVAPKLTPYLQLFDDSVIRPSLQVQFIFRLKFVDSTAADVVTSEDNVFERINNGVRSKMPTSDPRDGSWSNFVVNTRINAGYQVSSNGFVDAKVETQSKKDFRDSLWSATRKHFSQSYRNDNPLLVPVPAPENVINRDVKSVIVSVETTLSFMNLNIGDAFSKTAPAGLFPTKVTSDPNNSKKCYYQSNPGYDVFSEVKPGKRISRGELKLGKRFSRNSPKSQGFFVKLKEEIMSPIIKNPLGTGDFHLFKIVLHHGTHQNFLISYAWVPTDNLPEKPSEHDGYSVQYSFFSNDFHETVQMELNMHLKSNQTQLPNAMYEIDQMEDFRSKASELMSYALAPHAKFTVLPAVPVVDNMKAVVTAIYRGNATVSNQDIYTVVSICNYNKFYKYEEYKNAHNNAVAKSKHLTSSVRKSEKYISTIATDEDVKTLVMQFRRTDFFYLGNERDQVAKGLMFDTNTDCIDGPDGWYFYLRK